MPLITRIDNEVTTALKKFSGSEPEYYFYTIEGPSLLKTLLLAGGILAVFFQHPAMVAYSKGKFHFIPTSKWNTSTLFPEKAFSIKRSDIEAAKVFKFGPANYLTLKMKDGKKQYWVVNSLYKKLDGQAKGIEALKKELGV